MGASDDLSRSLRDQSLHGLACPATYTAPKSAASIALTLSVACMPQATLDDIGGAVVRRAITVLAERAVLPSPVVDARIVIASGTYAGSYYVTSVGAMDASGVLLHLRADDVAAARVAGAERRANG